MIEPILACPPPALMAIALVMQAAGAAASYAGKKRAAEEQQAYQDHLAEMQSAAALRKVTSINLRLAQEQEVTAIKMQQVSQQAAKAAAQGRLSMAAGGVTGLTQGLLAQTYDAQEAQYIYALKAEQAQKDAEAIRLGESAMLAGAQQMAATQAPVEQPSLLAAGLKFGAQAASTLAQASGPGGALDRDDTSNTIGNKKGGKLNWNLFG